MSILQLIYFFDAWITLCMTPIIYIWVIKPNKTLIDGLRDWIDESEDDI